MKNTTDIQTTARKLGIVYSTLDTDGRARLFGFMLAMIEDAGITFTAHNLPNEVDRLERHLRTMHDYLTK